VLFPVRKEQFILFTDRVIGPEVARPGQEKPIPMRSPLTIPAFHLSKAVLLCGFAFSGLVSCSACFASNGPGRQSSSLATDTFTPLQEWKEAVLAGDKIALAGFYASGHQAAASTPEGLRRNPDVEEPAFWCALVAKGLVAITPKILEVTHPLGAVKLILYIELTFKGRSQPSLVSAEQIWVKETKGDWKILITRRSGVEPAPAYSLPEPKTTDPHLYPGPTEAKRDLDSALAKSNIDHKHVLVIFGANWCYTCQVLGAALRSNALGLLVAANYHIVHVNVGNGESNADLAARFGISLGRGIPSIAILNPDGRVLMTHKEGESQSATHVGLDGIPEFFNRWNTPANNRGTHVSFAPR
jgi:thioredoxin